MTSLPVLVITTLLGATGGTTAQYDEVKSGTAFFVSAQGHLLTSAHIVTGCHRVTVWFPDKSGQTAKIISTDPDLDIALLEVPTGAAIHAIPSGLRSPHVGENVSIIAYGIHRSDPRRAEFVRGVVTGSGATSVSDRITVIRAALQPGTSGAPVIGSAGTLLGVIIGRYTAVPELAVSVSATDLAVFLSRNGITIPSAIGPTELTADPDALLSAISVLVQCTPV